MVPFWTCPGVPGLQSRFRACSVLSLGWRLERDGISGWLSFARAMRFIGFVLFLFRAFSGLFCCFRHRFLHALYPLDAVPNVRASLNADAVRTAPPAKHGQPSWSLPSEACSARMFVNANHQGRAKPVTARDTSESEASWIWCGLVREWSLLDLMWFSWVARAWKDEDQFLMAFCITDGISPFFWYKTALGWAGPAPNIDHFHVAVATHVAERLRRPCALWKKLGQNRLD